MSAEGRCAEGCCGHGIELFCVDRTCRWCASGRANPPARVEPDPLKGCICVDGLVGWIDDKLYPCAVCPEGAVREAELRKLKGLAKTGLPRRAVRRVAS